MSVVSCVKMSNKDSCVAVHLFLWRWCCVSPYPSFWVVLIFPSLLSPCFGVVLPPSSSVWVCVFLPSFWGGAVPPRLGWCCRSPAPVGWCCVLLYPSGMASPPVLLLGGVAFLPKITIVATTIIECGYTKNTFEKCKKKEEVGVWNKFNSAKWNQIKSNHIGLVGVYVLEVNWGAWFRGVWLRVCVLGRGGGVWGEGGGRRGRGLGCVVPLFPPSVGRC